MGEKWKQWQTIFLGSKVTTDGDCNLLFGRKAMTNLDRILKSRDIALPTKVHIVKAMVFPVVMYRELDHNEDWAPKNWCFWTMVLEKTLESPLDSKEIKPINPKGDQSWIFIGRTDTKAENPILWIGCEELTHWKRHWCWGRLRAGRKGETGIINSMDMSLNKLREIVKDRKAWLLQSTGSQRVGRDWATEQRQTCLARSVQRSSSERRKIISIGNSDQHKEGRYLRRKKWR